MPSISAWPPSTLSTMQPLPLPTATLIIKVFEDNSPPNLAADVPAEAVHRL
ncbi:MAG: hypothetical protein R3D55_28005 [Chloroflexota bacterium]